MRFTVPLFALMLLLLLSGCGGGGGGAAGTFTYSCQWNGNAGGINGQSQLIELYDANNVLKFTTTLESPATSVQLFGVPGGTYHLHAELYPQPGEQGAANGYLDDYLTLSGNKTYQVSVGAAVTAVQLSPTAATIVIPHTRQFYARSLSGAFPTFTAPGGFNWQALGGVASVDTDGLVTAVSAGSGSVTATNASANLTGAANLVIRSNSTTHSKWTVIVFMNAANDLSPFSVINMNQMESVAQNAQVRFVVEWKLSTNTDSGAIFNSTRRYLVKADTTNAIASEVVQDLGPGYDMGAAANMTDFINWAKTNYPADRYCVVVWNHGNGWARSPNHHSFGVSYDGETGDHIDTWQFAQALGNGSNDIVAWDASLMQQVEVAEEIRDKATYIVGSEESPPSAGYPYDTIFAHFRDNPDATTLTLAKTFVDETLADYGNLGTNKITQSVIDTSKLPALVTATGNLADALIANAGSVGYAAQQVRQNAQSYSDSVERHYRDLYDSCLFLEGSGAPTAVVNASQAVRSAIGQAVVYEGHNVNSPNSHGISIDFSNSVQFTTGSPSLQQDYANLRFGQETNWGQWLSTNLYAGVFDGTWTQAAPSDSGTIHIVVQPDGSLAGTLHDNGTNAGYALSGTGPDTGLSGAGVFSVIMTPAVGSPSSLAGGLLFNQQGHIVGSATDSGGPLNTITLDLAPQ